MTNAIKALAQWKESIPQDGLLDFVLKVILAKGFRIQTGEGILKIDTLQLEGKKRMDAQAFLRGYTVEEGMILPC